MSRAKACSIDAACPGLCIRITPKGVKTFAFAYRKGAGTVKWLMFGRYPDVLFGHDQMKVWRGPYRTSQSFFSNVSRPIRANRRSVPVVTCGPPAVCVRFGTHKAGGSRVVVP
jgi:hypothetical protein